MKILQHNHSAITATRPGRGFTLVEMMIATTVMTLFVIGGIMSANFLGLREDQLMESKAGANDTSRRLVNQMLYTIRSSKGYDIGNMSSGTNFTAITNGTRQGSALKLYVVSMTTNQVINSGQYIIYYYDTSQAANLNGVLWTFNSTNGLAASVVASNLIGSYLFTSEDYYGNTQNVRTEKGVIHTTLQFSQFLYPVTSVGSNGLYSSYQIDCRATPHIPDGQ
ncbi:MAG TPA: prepilin-type N-terminal cleavage/methylation domain-containing protein [Candidatus Sulfotelmatobacter sp.]|nr:prepilin-type N-terminal cleavage/methylation domain-containing protein [Candidatus Sulfotelmatobacter sp.]